MLGRTTYLVTLGLHNSNETISWIVIYSFATLLDSIVVRLSSVLQFLGTFICICILVLYIISCFAVFNMGSDVANNVTLKVLRWVCHLTFNFLMAFQVGYTDKGRQLIPKESFVSRVLGFLICYLVNFYSYELFASQL